MQFMDWEGDLLVSDGFLDRDWLSWGLCKPDGAL